MGRYVLSPSARLDLKQINSYLAPKNLQAARNLQEKMQQSCEKLANFPSMGRKRNELIPNLRSFAVGDYLIFYFAIDEGIYVLRIVSGYRDLEALFEDGIE